MDHITVPSVIFVQSNTLLCRWDSESSEKESPSESALPPKKPLVACSGERCLSGKDPASLRDCAPNKPLRLHSSNELQRITQASKASHIDLESVDLLPIEFNDKGYLKLAKTRPLGDVIRFEDTSMSNKAGSGTKEATVVFLIRRAGCGSCRDHGMQLSQLADEFGDRIKVMGIIKEGDAEHASLFDFYTEYFPFPVYQDSKRDTFKFMGNRKIPIFNLLTLQPRMFRRYHKRKIENVLVGGDIFTQGGILIFDKTGKLSFVYYERYGDRLDEDALRGALHDIVQNPRNLSFMSPLSDGNAPYETTPPRHPVR